MPKLPTNFEQEKQCGRTHIPWFQHDHKVTVNTTVWYCHKDKIINQWKRIQSPAKPSHVWSNDFWQGGKIIQGGKDSIPQNGAGRTWHLTQSCLTPHDPMDCSTPGLPVHHQLPESTQTHVHWVGDAIQPSHPLLIPSPPIFNLSRHQGLFKWGSSSHEVAKVLEFQLRHQSFHQIFRTDSFRVDWLDLLAVQGTLKSLLQHHSSKSGMFLSVLLLNSNMESTFMFV